MWMIAANFRRTHSPSRLARSEGWRPPGAQSTFIRWTGWTLAMTLGHDDSTINIVMAIIIIITTAQTAQFRAIGIISGTSRHREQQFADGTGTAPFPLAGHFQCKAVNIFSSKIHWSNFIKQHSETAMVWNNRNADCSLRKNLLRHLL